MFFARGFPARLAEPRVAWFSHAGNTVEQPGEKEVSTKNWILSTYVCRVGSIVPASQSLPFELLPCCEPLPRYSEGEGSVFCEIRGTAAVQSS